MPLSLFAPIDRWLAPAPSPGKVGWIGQWTFAHRGLHGEGVPENSLAAAQGEVTKGNHLGVHITEWNVLVSTFPATQF